ncbi:DUF397 domain-containing protein [Streptomyces griseoaurantiacus]|uniref:DUF397 domain-containing protein n=1 Tax=Streptomyces griseoaurantiacus TaxID=68213 RepID=A0A1G7QKD8_9ACTN|nr:DUF397 domain-containing protein [Streptomyces jietaisiensis]SDF98966.1 protein of unknown function [Streptomyces jietaisiensis]
MIDSPDAGRPRLAWVKSSYSNGAGGECVECARSGSQVLLRDTKTGDGLVAAVRSPAWLAFTEAVRRGWPSP